MLILISFLLTLMGFLVVMWRKDPEFLSSSSWRDLGKTGASRQIVVARPRFTSRSSNG